MSEIFKVLVVDDDERLRELLVNFLTQNNFVVDSASDTFRAEELIAKNGYDIVVLDRMIPKRDGIEFLQELRKNSDIPVIMLTAMGEFEDRVTGLSVGADDYLCKPFEPKELILRISSILKRIKKNSSTESKCIFGDFNFNCANQTLSKNGKAVYLTESEIKILVVLCKHKDAPISRSELSRLCDGIGERSVDVQMTRLRRKIEDDTKKPQFLKTVRNMGYMLQSM